MVNKKVTIGVLTFIFLISGIVYVSIGKDARIRIDNDKTTFYVPHETYPWIWTVSGREYSKLFDGTSQMNRMPDYINVSELINNEFIYRATPYIRGPIIVDSYYFNPESEDIGEFPASHKVEILGGEGYFYRYEVRDLDYSGETYKLNGETELTFGKNMKLTLEPGYRWAWVYQSGIVKAQYDIKSEYGVFNFRLYDPEPEGEPNKTIEIDNAEYTPTTRTICDNGICTKTLYSGTTNVYEDGVWKDIESARSLKGSGIDCFVDYDGEHIAECLDWNYTHKEVKFKINDDKNKNKDIPIKNYKISYDLDTGEKIKTKDKESKIKFEEISAEEILVLESGLGDELHFGESSTTIKLINNLTEYLEDTDTESDIPDYDSGNDVWIGCGGFNESDPENLSYRGYFKYTIITIPSDSTINEALFYFGGTINYYDADDTVNASVWELNNQTWREEGNSYNNPPQGEGDLIDLNESIPYIGNYQYILFNITEYVSLEYGLGHKNISLIMKSFENPQSEEQDFFYASSTEAGVSWGIYNSFLNITYTEGESGESVSIITLYPTGNINVTQNEFFNVSFNITCLTGSCGTINVSLDPVDPPTSKSGLINTTIGATPFYTNSTNPLTTSSLSAGQSETINFWVNATGDVDIEHIFYAYANLTSNLTISNITSVFNVTIREAEAPPSADCWTETTGKIAVPPGCQYYINAKEFILPS